MVWSWAWPALVAGDAGSCYFSKGCAQPPDTVGGCESVISAVRMDSGCVLKFESRLSV